MLILNGFRKMTNYSLYRKEIEVLEKIKQLYEQGQYISGYQESV